MSRTSRSSSLLVVAACALAVLPSLASAQTEKLGPAPAPPPPAPVPRVTVTTGWTLLGTARQGRAVVVRLGLWGGCDTRPVAALAEAPDRVSITTTKTQPGPGSVDACTLALYSGGTVTLPLAGPLAGRPVSGPQRNASAPYATIGARPEDRLVIPEVRGLRALDARRVLCAAGFASRIGGPVRSGRAVTRGTSPRAGRTLPRPSQGTLTKRRAAGSCTGAAWAGAPRVVVRTAAR